MVIAAMKLKDSLEGKLWQTYAAYEKQNHFANKGLYSRSYVFSSSPVRVWKLDHTEDWVPKNWCFQIVVLEKTPESP